MAQSLFAPRSFPPDAQFSQTALWPEISAVDLSSLGPRFEVPVVLIQGSEDIVTVTALAKDYFDSVEAPSKEFVLLPETGHLAIFRAQDAFLEALLDHVRPLAVSAQQGTRAETE
jgi:pimeloyl-ACP methyl ester carboxylesterase